MYFSTLQACCRRCLATAIVLLFFFRGYSDSPSHISYNINWQLEKTQNGVEFYYAITKCNTENIVLLKMKNKNNYSVEVVWREIFDTQVEKGKEPGVEKKIMLQPGETVQSGCVDITHPELVIFSSQINPTYIVIISKFNYKNITVSKVN